MNDLQVVRATVNSMPVKALGTQLFIGDKPDPQRFIPATNCDRRAYVGKPKGGLWTSSLNDDGASDWVRWCEAEDFGGVDVKARWTLAPLDAGRVIVVNGHGDLHRLFESYGTGLQTHYSAVLDFDAMIRDSYVGMHLTERGNSEVHLSYPLHLNAWDCESTVFFKWVFDALIGMLVWDRKERT